jgi:hypothetical protein
MEFIVSKQCSRCSNTQGNLHFQNHYYCKDHWGEVVCLDCYKKGMKQCSQCQFNLTYKPGVKQGGDDGDTLLLH